MGSLVQIQSFWTSFSSYWTISKWNRYFVKSNFNDHHTILALYYKRTNICFMFYRTVGVSTAAFILAMLEGSTQPGVWFPEEVCKAITWFSNANFYFHAFNIFYILHIAWRNCYRGKGSSSQTCFTGNNQFYNEQVKSFASHDSPCSAFSFVILPPYHKYCNIIFCTILKKIFNFYWIF